MQMTLNLAPNKHMLELNFDEDSSDQENQLIDNKDERQKFQKVYDLDADYVNLKRDKFTVNKVQKGLFVNETDNFQYDTYQVEHKPKKEKKYQKEEKKVQEESRSKSKNQNSTSYTNKHQLLNLKAVSLQFLQKPSSDEENSNHDSESSQKQASLKTPQKKFQSETLIESKKKLLELDFSESSSEEEEEEEGESEKSQKNSQNQANSQAQKQRQHQIKKPVIRKKQTKEHADDQHKSQAQQQDSSEQSQQSQQKQQPKQKPKQAILSDFVFDKQPQYQVLDQIRPQQRLRAFISRCRSGLNMIWPEYQVRLESTQQQILYVKKQTIFFRNVYKLYNRTMTGHHRYFGRLEANMAGTEYQVFVSENGVHESLRAELYFPNDARSNQPRYFIMLSLVDGYGVGDLVVTDPSNVSLKELYRNQQNKSKIMLLHTRKPIFNQQIRGFVLNFAGRVNVPSIKNFILQDVNTQKQVLMFGKMDKDNFRIQISSPLNCVLGTAVALIQFQGRFME